MTFSAIGFGYGLDLGNGTGRFENIFGFGTGFSFGGDTGGIYFVGLKGLGNNLIIFDFNLFPLGFLLRKNFIFGLGTGESNDIFSNYLLINLFSGFSITLYYIYVHRFFFLIIKINNNFYNLMSGLVA